MVEEQDVAGAEPGAHHADRRRARRHLVAHGPVEGGAAAAGGEDLVEAPGDDVEPGSIVAAVGERDPHVERAHVGAEEGAVLVPVGVGVGGHPPQGVLGDRERRALAEVLADEVADTAGAEQLADPEEHAGRVGGEDATAGPDPVGPAHDLVGRVGHEGRVPRGGVGRRGAGEAGVEGLDGAVDAGHQLGDHLGVEHALHVEAPVAGQAGTDGGRGQLVAVDGLEGAGVARVGDQVVEPGTGADERWERVVAGPYERLLGGRVRRGPVALGEPRDALERIGGAGGLDGRTRHVGRGARTVAAEGSHAERAPRRYRSGRRT